MICHTFGSSIGIVCSSSRRNRRWRFLVIELSLREAIASHRAIVAVPDRSALAGAARQFDRLGISGARSRANNRGVVFHP
jgi:hypothetical protein